jgi:hypothetical protein
VDEAVVGEEEETNVIVSITKREVKHQEDEDEASRTTK